MIGVILMALGFLILVITSRKYWLLPIVIYFIGMQWKYISLVGEEMKKCGVTNMNEATQQQQGVANELFKRCLLGWWKL